MKSCQYLSSWLYQKECKTFVIYFQFLSDKIIGFKISNSLTCRMIQTVTMIMIMTDDIRKSMNSRLYFSILVYVMALFRVRLIIFHSEVQVHGWNPIPRGFKVDTKSRLGVISTEI